MSPYEQIREAYETHAGDSDMTWEELVGFHLANPFFYVLKTPDYFVMGRPVVRSAGHDLIRDLTITFDPDSCDTWHLWALAGNTEMALAAMPYELPYLAWERYADGDHRVYPIEAVKRWVKPCRRAFAVDVDP